MTRSMTKQELERLKNLPKTVGAISVECDDHQEVITAKGENQITLYEKDCETVCRTWEYSLSTGRIISIR